MRLSNRQGGSTRSPQRGVSLVEVLVAMIVLSFGILTAVGLQVVAKRNNIDSTQQTAASVMAYDLIERMRSNSYSPGLQIYRSFATLGDGAVGDEPSPDCASADCSSAEMAIYDLWEWEQLVDGAAETVDAENVGGLASPTVCVTGPADGGSGVYAVVIAWRAATALPFAGDGADCGVGLGRYGDDEEYRRSMTVQAFVVSRGTE